LSSPNSQCLVDFFIMLQSFIGLIALSTLALLLGLGWARRISLPLTQTWSGRIIMAWTIFFVECSVVWAFIYPMGLTVLDGITFLLILAAIGWLPFSRISVQSRKFHINQLYSITVPLIFALIALVPAMSSFSTLSVAMKNGPDEIGWTAPAVSIAEGLTSTSLETQLHHDFTEKQMNSLFGSTPASSLIIDEPNFRTAVDAEFLIGDDRWSYSGTAAMFIKVLGTQSSWQIMSLLADFAFMVSLALLFETIVRYTGRKWFGFVGTGSVSLNCVLLYAWHQGGLGEVWILPAFVLIGMGLIELSSTSSQQSAYLIAAGVAILMPNYSEGLIDISLITVLFLLVGIFSKSLKGPHVYRKLVLGGACGAAIVPLASIAFAKSLTGTLHALKSGGWPTSDWIGPSEVMGLFNSFNRFGPIVSRNALNVTFTTIGDVFVVFVFLFIMKRKMTPAIGLLVALITGLIFVYIDSRYLQSLTNNYEFWKTASYFVPLIVLGMFTSLRVEQIPGPLGSRVDFEHKLVQALMTVFFIGVAFAGASLLVNFHQSGSTAPVSIPSSVQSQATQNLFEDVNIVNLTGPYLDNESIVPFVNYFWIGMEPGVRLPPSRYSRPLVLQINENECVDFKCTDSIKGNSIIFKSSQFELVEISNRSQAIALLPPNEYNSWAITQFERLGGLTYPQS
jgi:hypothetical protein